MKPFALFLCIFLALMAAPVGIRHVREWLAERDRLARYMRHWGVTPRRFESNATRRLRVMRSMAPRTGVHSAHDVRALVAVTLQLSARHASQVKVDSTEPGRVRVTLPIRCSVMHAALVQAVLAEQLPVDVYATVHLPDID